jgi:hypothetical protein
MPNRHGDILVDPERMSSGVALKHWSGGETKTEE